MRLKAALMSKPSAAQASEMQDSHVSDWNDDFRNNTECHKQTLTMYSQVKITAVKLVPGCNLTSVRSSKVSLGCDDVHLKRVDLQPHA